MKSPRRQCRNSTKRRRHRRDRQPPQLRHRKLILETLEDRRLLAELLDIVGFKWIDLDDDGRHDLNEPGFPEVTIYLDSDNNGQLDSGEISVVTQDDDPATPEDETGRYQFTGLEEAIYRVREVVPSDSEPTSPRHDGNEEVVNLNSRQSAQPPTVAIAGDGRYGVAYHDDFGNLWFRQFDTLGNSIGEPTQVNEPGEFAETAQVAMTENGETLVAWTNFSDDVSLRMGRYASDGTPFGSPVIIPDIFANSISIDVSSDGTGVLAWPEFAFVQGVMSFHKFDANGQLTGDRLSYSPAGHNVIGGQIIAAAGQMWAIVHTAGNPESIFLQRFSQQGEPIGAEIRLSTTAEELSDPAIASLGSEGVIAVWSELDSQGARVMAQRFNASGEPDGLYEIADLQTDQPPTVGVESDANGNHMVVWHDGDSSDSDQQVMAQSYNADGDAVRTAFQVNDTSNHNSPTPDVATGPAGHSVVVYNGALGSTSDVVMRRYVAPGESGSFEVTAGGDVPTVSLNFGNFPLFDLLLDWGDAPDSYSTVKTSGGPRHRVVAGIHLGGSEDTEVDGQPGIEALGDGITDDDGVKLLTPLIPGENAILEVSASTNGFVSGWIDFNGDGRFDEQLAENGGEKILDARGVAAGKNLLTVPVPSSAISFPYARFRYSVVGGGLPAVGGGMPIGEVEDYALMDFGDAPELKLIPGTFPTLRKDDGARHLISTLYLGTANPAVDAPSTEIDANIGPAARADNNEASVKFNNFFPPDMSTTITVQASSNGFLDAFVDFNNDGDWDDADERIFNKQPLTAGNNVLPPVRAPKDAHNGVKYARFRISTIGGLDPIGFAPNGEVEDYAVGLAVNSTRDSSGNDAGDRDPDDGLCDTGHLIQRKSDADPSKIDLEPECTLRAAIQQANAIEGLSPIVFNIPKNDPNFGKNSPGAYTIDLQKALDPVTQPVFLDATTQPGFVDDPDTAIDQPVIELNVKSFVGMTIEGGNSTIKGFVFNGVAAEFDPTAGAALTLQNKGENVVENNFFGTDVEGKEARGKRSSGMQIKNVSDNLVKHNLISGNVTGVLIDQAEATGNKIEGNYIGTDVDGKIAIANVEYGIAILNASDNTIGGKTEAARNIISGNGGVGESNHAGVIIQGESANDGNNASGNKVQGNYIGLNKDGNELHDQSEVPTPVGNNIGIVIVNASENLIGGTTKEEGNVISSNEKHGIVIQGTTGKLGKDATKNKIQGNYIGTNVDGKKFYVDCNCGGNKANGIEIRNASENEIGGMTPLDAKGAPKTGEAPGNVISNNGKAGILLSGKHATKNVVAGNLIGTDASQEEGANNGTDGIRLDESAENVIGGTKLESRNVISGNAEVGIFITGVEAKKNKIQGNVIGAMDRNSDGQDNDNDGTTDEGDEFEELGNKRHGLFVEKGNENEIGGISGTTVGKCEGPCNVIAYNGETLEQSGHGIVVKSGTANSIRRNSIYANEGRGIDLGDNSFNINDVGDPETGANHSQDYPVVTRVVFTTTDPNSTTSVPNGEKRIYWSLNSTPSTQFEIDFFANNDPDPNGFGEGRVFIDSNSGVRTDAHGNLTFSENFDVARRFISATATDSDGNTSEFSMVDTDGDAIADAWETQGIDHDADGEIEEWEKGTIDINEDGTNDQKGPLFLKDANYQHKDLFVEVDLMVAKTPSNVNVSQPTQAVLNQINTGAGIRGGFSKVPHRLVQNPDSQKGITLHAMLSDINLPDTVFTDASPWTNFDALKNGNPALGVPVPGFFGNPSERSGANSDNVLKAKKLVYRYTIFGNARGGTNGTSGQAELPNANEGPYGANDFQITLGNWSTAGGTAQQQQGTFMHEIGHTLGLGHGGDQLFENHKPNYYSVMNYLWQAPRTNWGTWQLDYSQVDFGDLNETNLNEGHGVITTTIASDRTLASDYANGNQSVMLGPPIARFFADQPPVTNDNLGTNYPRQELYYALTTIGNLPDGTVLMDLSTGVRLPALTAAEKTNARRAANLLIKTMASGGTPTRQPFDWSRLPPFVAGGIPIGTLKGLLPSLAVANHNGNGTTPDNQETMIGPEDINGDNRATVLTGHEDWSKLKFYFLESKAGASDGVHDSVELEESHFDASREITMDFGDAPDESLESRYPTLLSNNGARHVVIGIDNPLLGFRVDLEGDAQPDDMAMGDDGDDGIDLASDSVPSDPQDEDGVQFNTALTVGQTANITVTVSLREGISNEAKLDAWMDFNFDGDWDDDNEQIFDGAIVVNGENLLNIDVPLSATSGTTFARFRLSSEGNLAPTGVADDGEVEDYAVEIARPWQNPVNRFDVNGDGNVTPIDVLIVVHDLSTNGARILPDPALQPNHHFLDVSGEGAVSPLDALLVIHELSGSGDAEGEASGHTTSNSFVQEFDFFDSRDLAWNDDVDALLQADKEFEFLSWTVPESLEQILALEQWVEPKKTKPLSFI